MSQRKEKLKRKITKMEDQKNNLSFSHFENYIALHTVLTGKKPENITLAPSVYTWYVQEAQRHAETLNLNLGFKNDKIVFNGVELIKRVDSPKLEITADGLIK